MSIYQPDKNRRAYVVDRLNGKITKEEANYRPHDNADRKDVCMECSFYVNPTENVSSCRRVAGPVVADDTCDLWAARSEESKSAQPQMSINIQVGKG